MLYFLRDAIMDTLGHYRWKYEDVFTFIIIGALFLLLA